MVCRFSALQTVLVPRPQWLTDGLRLLSGTPVCHHRLVGIRLGAGLQATGIGCAGLFFVFRMRSGFCSTQEISACLSNQRRDCCPTAESARPELHSKQPNPFSTSPNLRSWRGYATGRMETEVWEATSRRPSADRKNVASNIAEPDQAIRVHCLPRCVVGSSI